MTFLNDLWKRIKVTPEKTFSESIAGQKTVLNAIENHKVEAEQADLIRKNLAALKALVDQPKEEAPEVRFTKIKQLLNPPVEHETVRQERMQPNIHCPDCLSGNLKRLAQLPTHSPFKHRYRCMECGLVFNDDTGTPLERDIPPLNIWMQCWYLMGCTESISYIAAKLNLDIGTVEYMMEQLRTIFNAHHPLTRFIKYDEWSKQSQHLRMQLKEDLLKQYERLSADIAGIPKDTAEFRRQQNLRRELNITPEPPSGGKKKR